MDGLRFSAAPWAALVLALLVMPGTAQGQDDVRGAAGCEGYDACALRVQYGFINRDVIRGSDGPRVARIGFRTPPLDDLFARSAPAAASFEEFSADHVRSSWFALLGGLGWVGGIIASSQDEDDWAMGLSIGGTVFEVTASIFRTKSSEHLSEAIWWYNESLVEPGGR